MSDKTPAPRVWPTLRAHDARALISFLVEAFGFTETVVYGDGDSVSHAELSWPPGGGIMLGAGRGAADDEGPQALGGLSAYAVTDEPDVVFARAVARGAVVVTEPHDTDYGSREFSVRDPEGNRWSFGSYRGASRSESGTVPQARD
jgi:uncharacterized glyoxalase superfamily protein PhnB